MKNLILLVLSLVLVLSLCACGQTAAPATEATKAQQPTESATEAATEPATEAAAATEPAADAKTLAQSCETKSVDELFALIGQPQSSEYAPSCLHPGVGEDGMLYYEGFVVYTYKEGDSEIVEYVE